jgi:antitoxin component YwqK of YwqJK toxin-antitoxin module
MLSKCIEFCQQYPADIVYKSCGEHIVVLEKLSDTITNENRDNIGEPMHAKFRANKLKVLCIFSKDNPIDQLDFIENTSYTPNIITYRRGETIEIKNFDTNLNEVCAEGIHYFKSLESAYYYSRPIDKKYTGGCVYWHDNGQCAAMHNYVDGQLHGQCKKFYDSGRIQMECIFKNGKYHGPMTIWDNNGTIEKRMYVNGLAHGKSASWYKNGRLAHDGEYVNGDLHGKYVMYDMSGKKIKKGVYVNGIFRSH